MWYGRDLNAINIVSRKRINVQHYITAYDVLALVLHAITEVSE